MKNYILIFSLVLIAGFIGFIAGKHFGKSKKVNIPIENLEKTEEFRLGGYKFINPLLECDNYHQSELLSAQVLEKNVKNLIDNAISSGRATQISFYYRDLTNGPWIGIGEKDNYSPASLLKVPLMIAAFKKAEAEPGFLKKKIRFQKDFNSGMIQNITDSVLKIGNSYSIEKLIYYMIVHSDNNARILLYQNIDLVFINQVFFDIGIDIANLNDSSNFMSAKKYSSFFRMLYNATYLNKDNSEKALQILSNSSFPQGIPALLPGSALIAHKFGERGYSNSALKQLHDCGIVYKGNSPYLICVMSMGNDFHELTKIIADISLLVYSHN